MVTKLNFGCGSIQPEGWINSDKDVSFSSYSKIGNTFWSAEEVKAWGENYFDIIVAHAVIQQFEWHHMVMELQDIHEMLKPGGVLRISLPDIISAFVAYDDGDIDWFPNGEEKIDDRFSAWLTWYSTTKTLLTSQALKNKLIEVGFDSVLLSDYKTTHSKYSEITELDTRQGEFYFVEAFKN